MKQNLATPFNSKKGKNQTMFVINYEAKYKIFLSENKAM